MFQRILFYTLLLWCSGRVIPAFAQQQQQALECNPEMMQPIVRGDVFFNYGSATDAYSIKNRSSYSLGQAVVGFGVSQSNFSNLGYWSSFLIPPLAPIVTATQGELLDRIQISWGVQALGAQPSEGFKIYRDGVFLALVDNNTDNYNDFNVIAGKAYKYEVSGINSYGDGVRGSAIGFQVPNGVVTGWVQTLNGSPVPNAMVTLMPMQGFSAKFGPLDGAFAEADTSANPFLPSAGDDWTMTFWIKTNAATANAGLIQLSPFPLYFRALNSAGGQEGVELATSAAGAPFLSGTFADSTKNGWHHVALSFDGSGGQGRLYINGVLVALAPMNIVAAADVLNIGNHAGVGGWTGRLDELRIYHRQLDELDFREVMEGTASSLTPNLSHYWKMDEQQGVRSYDVIKRQKLHFCGAAFDAQRPPVRTAGKTNGDGYYRIESASYGTGTTFLAEPVKEFYMHRALKMVRDEADYARLPDFSVTPKATLEVWLNSAGPDGEQCVLSKKWPGNDFRLLLRQNGLGSEVWFYLNGAEHKFGNLGMGYQHLAFTIDSSGSNRTVTAYKNGTPFGVPKTFAGITGTWSDSTQTWVVGARPSGGSYTDHFGGLLDEIALYDTTLSAITILDHFQNSREMQERGLRVYFALDEGNGVRLNNSGSVLLSSGTNVGGDWSPFAANQMTEPHIFTPVTRQVTLNPSVTSVDQVDFIDRSTVAVSGFVRYKNTDCFAKNVEILVNGASFSPRIYTDSTGRFVIDFDPGTTAILTPVFEDHQFIPASWEVINVISPLAGVLFNDVTTRNIEGVVAGGNCKLPIISSPGTPAGTVCIVKVRTLDGCYEKIIEIDNVEGEYQFANLPPLEMTVAVVEHSDPTIKTSFQVAGGQQVDLSKKDTILDFIYYAQPEVEIVSGLEPFSLTCPTIVLEPGIPYLVKIKVKEVYLGVACYLDTAQIHIINDAASLLVDIPLSNGLAEHTFKVGAPNPNPPFLQNFQAIATTLSGNETSLTVQVLVTGLRSKGSTFTTQLPETPTMVLRDPPGDGSYSFLEKGQKTCHTVTTLFDLDIGAGGGVYIDGSPEVNTVTAPLGIGVWTSAGGGVDGNLEGQATFQKVTNDAFEVCTSFSERLSTNGNDQIVGGADSIAYLNGWIHGGDVFLGGGLNVEFGFADEVSFNDTICEGEVTVKLNVSPKNFGTTFMYSDFYIRNYVIRYLQAIADDPATEAGKRDTCLQSVVRWNKILRNNKKQIAAAKFRRNISFDAGFEYEYSESSDSTTTNATTTNFNTEAEASVIIKFDAFGAGVQGTVKFLYSLTKGETKQDGSVKGIKTGFVLKDDDTGDAYTVDVAMDSIYNTPVFRTVTGQSSCPWEPRTAHREGNTLEFRDGSSATAIDVPANEPASFKFTMGNKSESNETFTYSFATGPESNPHGAKIFLNGAALDHPVFYAIPYGTSIPVTIEVERGPEEYDYDSLEVVLYSLCEDIRANALGILPDLDTVLYSAQYVSVHFLRPCSEVDINVPQQDWVVFPDPLTQGSDNIMRITVSGYDKSEAEFDKIRVQYRRSNGDGAWINIVPPSDPAVQAIQPGAEIEKADLGSVFTQFYWETTGLSDGPYEIRAIAICSGNASDKPGYSQIIKGRIDREPPSLVGTPEPSDGVYHVGDEISFTFNKHINCNKLIPADITQPNNVGLYDATTGLLIDADITCFENKIIIDPNFQNEFFENRILRTELHDIEDLTGNSSTFLKWEFYVDRNELAWLTDSLGMTKFEDQTKTATANIHNRGGYPVPFTITGVPNWVHVVPNQGTLAPNEIRPVSFTVDSSLAFGLWSDSITLHTETGQNPFFMGGDEGLPFGVRVVCRPPNWDLNAGIFENSENMVLELNIQGVVSQDVEDMVVAYIGDTLVGRAHVQYVPEVDKYLAYLTIYGNPNQVLLPLRLEIWDASACLRYAVVEDDFTFQPDNIIGNPLAPQVVHTSGYVLRDVPLGFGWNWLSFNLAFPNPDLDSVLVSLQHPENDLMKGQNAFSIYVPAGGWLGSLQTLGNTSMYIYRADQPDTLKMLGNLIDPAATLIPVVAGWNWIGYIPNYSLPVNAALSSVPAQTGDLIKGQLSFAQYINPTFGWIGNLKYMSPPNGYQIKLSGPGTLVYPPPSNNLNNGGTNSLAQQRPTTAAPRRERAAETPPANFWIVDPTQFEYSMTLIGMLKVNDGNGTTATMELGAFAPNGEVRGSGTAIYIAPLQSYLFFLTMYSNTNGEQLHYKLFDSSTGAVVALNEQLYFSPDLHQGSIEVPVPFTLTSSGTQEQARVQSFDVQPNPFHTETMLRFALPQAQEVTVTVTSTEGRVVSRVRTLAREGLNTLVWKGQSDAGASLAPGIYFVRLQTEGGSVVRKVMKQ